MSQGRRNSHVCASLGVEIETYIDGDGPSFVILPSYGRDGGADFDDLTQHLVADGWKVLRPQPRGVAGSTGSMSGLTLHDLADDVARSIRALSVRPVVMLGHAFGHVMASAVTTDHPDLVSAVVLAAAGSSGASQVVNEAPFIAGDLSRPAAERLDVLRKAFFAPGHDPSVWLSGWYPSTLRMQHDAVKSSDLKEFSACGTVPLLQVIAEHDPFNPKPYWNALKDQLGDRLTQKIVAGASHALFPEQRAAVAEAVVSWAAARRR